MPHELTHKDHEELDSGDQRKLRYVSPVEWENGVPKAGLAGTAFHGIFHNKFSPVGLRYVGSF